MGRVRDFFSTYPNCEPSQRHPLSDLVYFKDLTRYEYSKHPFKCAGDLYNIGWLERCAAYPKGTVGAELMAKLLTLCKFPVNRYRGFHGCHFCNEYPVRITDFEGEFFLGDGEIRVPSADEKVRYVAPNLIYHYVSAHDYLPPDVFLDAVQKFSLPNPAVFWILEEIEGFENQLSSIAILSNKLDWILRKDRPCLPPELPGTVLEAVSELKLAQSLRSDAQETADKIVNRLKSVLTTG